MLDVCFRVIVSLISWAVPLGPVLGCVPSYHQQFNCLVV